MKVIESKHYVNTLTGQTASIFGSSPAGLGWELKTRGWTIEHKDGTVGIGRAPFKTLKAAQDYVTLATQRQEYNRLLWAAISVQNQEETAKYVKLLEDLEKISI
jgi:hypothetical protein